MLSPKNLLQEVSDLILDRTNCWIKRLVPKIENETDLT